MTISEVSKKYAISPDTLRWYEKIGLLKKINRKQNGLRDYDEDNCKTIEFVICMRNAGVSVETLLEYMKLYEQGDETLLQRKQLLIRQKEIILQKKESLQQSLERLNYKIDHYDTLIAQNKKMNQK